jgi:hypothetical protein
VTLVARSLGDAWSARLIHDTSAPPKAGSITVIASATPGGVKNPA